MCYLILYDLIFCLVARVIVRMLYNGDVVNIARSVFINRIITGKIFCYR